MSQTEILLIEYAAISAAALVFAQLIDCVGMPAATRRENLMMAVLSGLLAGAGLGVLTWSAVSH